MKKRLKIAIAILVVLSAGLYAYNRFSEKKENALLVTQKVNINDMTLSVSAEGVIEAKKIVNVFSNTSAVVEKINYRSGEQVKKGDVLLQLKQDKYDISKLNIEQSKLMLDKMKKEYEDSKRLYKLGAISKDALNTAKISYNEAEIKNKTYLNEYKKFNKYIKSPISGVILETNADVDYTIDTRKPLFRIADTENLQAVLEVSNAISKKIKVNDMVYINSDSINEGVTLTGIVKSISNISFKSKFSNENITRVFVELDNYKNLKPGDSVEAKIVYQVVKNKIIVPFQYIVNKNGKNYIYINNNGIVEEKEVTLGQNNGLEFEILDGIKSDYIMIYNAEGNFKVGDTIK